MKLAEKCKVSPSYIGEIEIGRKFPSASTLQKISDALGIKPYQLFLDIEDRENLIGGDLLNQLFKDLKGKVNAEIDDLKKQYVSKGGGTG